MTGDEMNSNIAEIDRKIYGLTAPSWNDCLDLLGDSLVQLHINDGRGIGVSGEGLMLSEGEIPLRDILRYFGFGSRWEERHIQATIELRVRHLSHDKLQGKAMEWLLENTGTMFC